MRCGNVFPQYNDRNGESNKKSRDEIKEIVKVQKSYFLQTSLALLPMNVHKMRSYLYGFALK